MIFLTVGTQLPFDRLVSEVLQLNRADTLFFQQQGNVILDRVNDFSVFGDQRLPQRRSDRLTMHVLYLSGRNGPIQFFHTCALQTVQQSLRRKISKKENETHVGKQQRDGRP